MEQRLTELGFRFIGTCRCDGTLNKKYKGNEFLVYITPTRFKVKKHGTTIKGYADIEKIEEYLKAAIPGLYPREQI